MSTAATAATIRSTPVRLPRRVRSRVRSSQAIRSPSITHGATPPGRLRFTGASRAEGPRPVRRRTAAGAEMRHAQRASEEVAMTLVVLDPRTGERVIFEIADTPQGKRIVKRTRGKA